MWASCDNDGRLMEEGKGPQQTQGRTRGKRERSGVKIHTNDVVVGSWLSSVSVCILFLLCLMCLVACPSSFILGEGRSQGFRFSPPWTFLSSPLKLVRYDESYLALLEDHHPCSVIMICSLVGVRGRVDGDGREEIETSQRMIKKGKASQKEHLALLEGPRPCPVLIICSLVGVRLIKRTRWIEKRACLGGEEEWKLMLEKETTGQSQEKERRREAGFALPFVLPLQETERRKQAVDVLPFSLCFRFSFSFSSIFC